MAKQQQLYIRVSIPKRSSILRGWIRVTSLCYHIDFHEWTNWWKLAEPDPGDHFTEEARTILQQRVREGTQDWDTGDILLGNHLES